MFDPFVHGTPLSVYSIPSTAAFNMFVANDCVLLTFVLMWKVQAGWVWATLHWLQSRN